MLLYLLCSFDVILTGIRKAEMQFLIKTIRPQLRCFRQHSHAASRLADTTTASIVECMTGKRSSQSLLQPRTSRTRQPHLVSLSTRRWTSSSCHLINLLPYLKTTATLQERLKLFKYDRATLAAALNGKEVPFELGAPETQVCIIRGIRHHDGFGTGLRGYAPFDRALNARAIMSNTIPDINAEDETPYCIWYPDVSSQETYRKLAKRYPQMRYQVGRACAVAGYVDLYRELGLLPEVSIAEEARDNAKNGRSMEIFDEIMSAPQMYSVMDDYTRTINTVDPRRGACLNADTAVRSSLDLRHRYSYWMQREQRPPPDYAGLSPEECLEQYRPNWIKRTGDIYWNIIEDWKQTDEEPTSWMHAPAFPDLRVPLLYSPLPTHLPAINKDVLIYQAAYSGNIERYTRLRRPVKHTPFEEQSIVHGILHNTMFAKWWSLQPEILAGLLQPDHPHVAIIRAINARYIMNNNLTRITADTPEDQLPQIIYWPNLASKYTYEDLFKIKPSMETQIAHACIIGNYEELYRKLDVAGSERLCHEAVRSGNSFYKEDQREKGVIPEKMTNSWKRGWILNPEGMPLQLLMDNGTHCIHDLDDEMEEESGIYGHWADDEPSFEDDEEGYEAGMYLLEEEAGQTRLPLYEDCLRQFQGSTGSKTEDTVP